MKKKLLATLLVLCMILPSFGGLSALALDIIDMGDNATLICDNPYNKIHFYFDDPDNATIDDAAELQAATAAVKGDYAAALMAADGEGEVNENVYITVQFASDYMETNEYEVFKAALESATTPEMRDTVKTQRNTFSKRYHAAIIEENLPILAQIPYTDVDKALYSAFVVLTVSAEALMTDSLIEIAENDNILHISLADGYEAIDDVDETASENTNVDMTSWEEVLKCVGADNVVGGSLNGQGIKIGVYEAGGVCDPAHTDLVGKNITFRYENYRITDHATWVTTILARIAPNAEFYIGPVDSYISLSWFIEQGCDIVNCSFGYNFNDLNEDGTYTEGARGYRYDIDARIDDEVESYGIVVVTSAGNKETDNTSKKYNPDGKISSPGYAYNAITVGGVEYSTSEQGWIHADGASYVSTESIKKPNVAAPYNVTIEGLGSEGGTSLSTPIVAGCIALMMQNNNRYIGSPEYVMSQLIATANKTEDYTMSLGANRYTDLKVGAGIIDLERMITNGAYVNTMVYNTNIATTVVS